MKSLKFAVRQKPFTEVYFRMKTSAKILFVTLFVILNGCISYTRNLTASKQTAPDSLATIMKPDKTYKLKLRNGKEFKVTVITISSDSLYGNFHYRSGASHSTFNDSIALDTVVDVKAPRTDVIKTVIIAAVPVVLIYYLIANMSYDLGGGPIM